MLKFQQQHIYANTYIEIVQKLNVDAEIVQKLNVDAFATLYTATRRPPLIASAVISLYMLQLGAPSLTPLSHMHFRHEMEFRLQVLVFHVCLEHLCRMEDSKKGEFGLRAVAAVCLIDL